MADSRPPVLLLLLVLCQAAGARPRSQGTVRIFSEPSGATVTIDGEAVGETPRSVELTPGRHALRLSLEGYVAQTHTLTVKRGEWTKLYLRLTKAAVNGIRVRAAGDKTPPPGAGTVTVITRPPGVTVLVDGVKLEQPTPVTFDVAPGRHALVFEREGVELLRTSTTVREGWTAQVRHDLTKAMPAAARPAGGKPPAPARCSCPTPRAVKACVERRRVCRYRAERGGHALCTGCADFRRLARRRRAAARRACDTRFGSPDTCVCQDMARVVERCLDPQRSCRERCGGGEGP